MARNPRDGCPECLKTLLSDASHFSGEIAGDPGILRCVLYEMFMLAASAAGLKSSWSQEVTHTHPKLGRYTPSEGLKRSALVSFRLLHDFLYNPNSRDDFSLGDFLSCGVVRPTEPAFVGFEPGKCFTRESVNKWVAHLTWVRINKPHCVPQPKFSIGDEAIMRNARLLLADAMAFVESVIDSSNPRNVVLDESGEGYWQMFNAAFATLPA